MERRQNQYGLYLLGMLGFFTILRVLLPTFPLDGIWEGNQIFRFFLPAEAPPLFNKIITRANIGPYGDPYGYALLGIQRYVLDFFEINFSLSSMRSILTLYYALSGFFFYRVIRISFTEKIALASTFLFLSHSWVLGYSDYFQPVIISILVMLILIDRSYYLFKSFHFEGESWLPFVRAHKGQLVFFILTLGAAQIFGQLIIPLLSIPLFFGIVYFYRSRDMRTKDWYSAASYGLRVWSFGAAAALACTHYIFVRFVFLIILSVFFLKLVPWGAFQGKKWRDQFLSRLSLTAWGFFYFLIFLRVSWEENLSLFFNSIYVRVNQGSLAESVFTYKNSYTIIETIQYNFYIFWKSFICGEMFLREGKLDLANFYLDGYYQFTSLWFLVLGFIGLFVSYKKIPKESFLYLFALFSGFLLLPHLSVIHTADGFLNPSYSTHRLVFFLLPLIPCYIIGSLSISKIIVHFGKLNKKVGFLIISLLILVPGFFETYRYTEGLLSYRTYLEELTYENVKDYLYYEENPREKAPQRGIRIYFYLLAKKVTKIQESMGRGVAIYLPTEKFFPEETYSWRGLQDNLYHLGTGTVKPVSHVITYLPAYFGERGLRANYIIRGDRWALPGNFHEIHLVNSKKEISFLKETKEVELIPLVPPSLD